MDIVGDGPILSLAGDFDVRSTWEVRIALYDHLSRFAEVTVDLAGVEVIDVTALKVLAAASRWASTQGKHLTLRECRPAVRRMLHISRLARVIEVERVPA